NNIRDRVVRMDHLIDGILEYSRAGRLAMPVQRIDTHTIAEKLISSLDLPKTIDIHIDGRLPILTTNTAMFEQNLQNLIGNAARHMGRADGTIRIAQRETADHHEFTVSDNGVG